MEYMVSTKLHGRWYQLILVLIARVEISLGIVRYCGRVEQVVTRDEECPISMKFFQLSFLFLTFSSSFCFLAEGGEGREDVRYLPSWNRCNRQIGIYAVRRAKFDVTNHPLSHSWLINPLGSIRLTNKLPVTPSEFESTGTGTRRFTQPWNVSTYSLKLDKLPSALFSPIEMQIQTRTNWSFENWSTRRLSMMAAMAAVHSETFALGIECEKGQYQKFQPRTFHYSRLLNVRRTNFSFLCSYS